MGRSQGEMNLEGISAASDGGGWEGGGIGTPLSIKSCTAGETSFILAFICQTELNFTSLLQVEKSSS